MKYLPEPDSFYENERYSNQVSIMITPYRSLNWKDLVTKYGIQVPDIIDRTCGKSKCDECNAIYVGHQSKCEAMVEFHRKPEAYYDTRGYHYMYRNFVQKCGGYLRWELQSQFNLQTEFFSLLEIISSLPPVIYDPFIKFSEHFPPGVPELLRTRILSQEMQNVKAELNLIKMGMQQIAQKMNSAGACLSFGF
jgi:hypothetical protein